MFVVLVMSLAALAAGGVAIMVAMRLVGVRQPEDAVALAADRRLDIPTLLEFEDPWEVMRVRVLTLEVAADEARHETEILQAELRRAQSRVAALEAVASYRFNTALAAR